MPFPGNVIFRSELSGGLQTVAKELDQEGAALNEFLSAQHESNGSHGVVTAESITLAPHNPTDATVGLVTVQDEDDVTANLYRSRTGGTILDLGQSVSTQATAATNVLNLLAYFVTLHQNLIRLGTVGDVSYGPAPGIRIYPDAPGGNIANRRSWEVISTVHAGGPVLSFADASALLEVCGIRWDGTRYALMPDKVTSGLIGVDLGASDSPWTRVYAQSVISGGITQGAWTDVAYNAANFTVNAGAWTVQAIDQATYAWSQVGKTMTVAFVLANTSLSGAPTSLFIAIPNGAIAARQSEVLGLYADAGTGEVVPYRVIVVAAGTTMILARMDSAAWANSTNQAVFNGTITFSVQ